MSFPIVPTITSKSGKQITLRSPREGDEQLLFDYAKRLEAEDTFVILNPEEPLSWEDEQEYLASTLKKIQNKQLIYLMAIFDNRIIGSSQVAEMGKRMHHVGRLGIAVDQDFRQDGIGSKLMQFTIDKAQKELNITQIILSVFATNHIAQKMYQKSGFKHFSTHPQGIQYKGKYVDHVWMYKDLE